MPEHVLSSKTPAEPAQENYSGRGKRDHPGVYIPPPVLYAMVFILSLILQKIIPIRHFIAGTALADIMGCLFIFLWLCLFLPALNKFVASKNTLVTIRPASALQTTGIFNITRNPMYLSLIMLYTGIAMFKGNWYTLLLIPLLFFVVQSYIIRKEEKYLERAFGEEFRRYKSRVRRWI